MDDRQETMADQLTILAGTKDDGFEDGFYYLPGGCQRRDTILFPMPPILAFESEICVSAYEG